MSSTTIPLPAGNYSTLNLLGSAVNGNQPNQSFVVTYTDGTTTTITQSLSDWWGPPQNYAGESQVLKMAYLVTPTGATMNQVVYVYGYSFAINSAKTVKSLTLPNNRNVVVLAIEVQCERGNAGPRLISRQSHNVDGIVNNGTAPINGGWDNMLSRVFGEFARDIDHQCAVLRSRWVRQGEGTTATAGCADASDLGHAGDNGRSRTILQFQANRRGLGRFFVDLRGGE